MEFWCLIDLQERFGASVSVDGAARNQPANRKMGQKLDFPFIIIQRPIFIGRVPEENDKCHISCGK
jgi:hypothetical protein